MLLGKVPDGHYKLSREAILVAELPTAFTARSNWKGPLPRDLLCVFCCQHRLLEPLFSVKGIDSSETQMEEAYRKVKLPRSAGESEVTNGPGIAASDRDSDKPTTFKCEVKILSRRQDIILECLSANAYKKEFDAIQNVALEVITWFNKYFKQLDMSIENLASFGYEDNITIYPHNFCREFAQLVSIYGAKQNYYLRKCVTLQSIYKDEPDIKLDNGVILDNVEGDDSGVFPLPRSLTCISYTVTLMRKGEPMKQLIESRDEFEFEGGTGAVINQLEACATQLSVNQAAKFITELPSKDLLLAAAGDCIENLANSSLCEFRS